MRTVKYKSFSYIRLKIACCCCPKFEILIVGVLSDVINVLGLWCHRDAGIPLMDHVLCFSVKHLSYVVLNVRTFRACHDWSILRVLREKIFWFKKKSYSLSNDCFLKFQVNMSVVQSLSRCEFLSACLSVVSAVCLSVVCSFCLSIRLKCSLSVRRSFGPSVCPS